MAKKSTVATYTIKFEADELLAMGVAERKSTIEQTFESAKQSALSDFDVRTNG